MKGQTSIKDFLVKPSQHPPQSPNPDPDPPRNTYRWLGGKIGKLVLAPGSVGEVATEPQQTLVKQRGDSKEERGDSKGGGAVKSQHVSTKTQQKGPD